jgi:hypothetical protein
MRSKPSTMGVGQGQDHLGETMATVAPRMGQMLSKEVADCSIRRNFTKESHASKVRQTTVVTGDSQNSRRA